MAAERTYTVILEPEETGGYVVRVPALPEVCTQGDTEADALANASEAIELAVVERLAEGEAVPSEREPHIRKVKINVKVPSAA